MIQAVGKPAAGLARVVWRMIVWFATLKPNIVDW